MADIPVPIDVPIFYVSAINVQTATNDIRILAGQVLTATPAKGDTAFRIAPKWTVGITLSPQTAKQFALMLATAVATYEKEFGKLSIKMPGPPTRHPLKVITARKGRR